MANRDFDSELLTNENDPHGIKRAARNLNGDPKALAEYVYQVTSEYFGGDHERFTVEITREAIIAAQLWPVASPWGVGRILHREDGHITESYGYGDHRGDPDDFVPDAECVSPREFAAWHAAKIAKKRGT